MDYEFKMPDLATTGSAVKVLRWLVQPGEPVTRGQFLLEVETDKAAMEVEATISGTLKETRVGEGEAVDAGTVLALIASGTETAAASASPADAPPSVAKTEERSPSAARVETAAAHKNGGLFARNRAGASKSGQKAENGNAAVQVGALPAKAADVPGGGKEGLKLSPARKTAARRLQQSKQTIPHFYLQISVNAEPMIAARKSALPHKLVWDAFFVKAAHQALQRFEQMAYRFEDEQLIPQGTDTIGVAADIAGDLFVIPVEDPGSRSVEEISRYIREKVSALQKGDPAARAMKPGVMSVTNLGSTRVETFTAIVNPPESAILAIGKVQPVVVAASDTGSVIQHRANLTLSVDHRVVNGKYAADFLAAIVDELEKL